MLLTEVTPWRMGSSHINPPDAEKTDSFENLVFKTKINAFTDKVEKGYMLGKTENLPLTITSNEATNAF